MMVKPFFGCTGTHISALAARSVDHARLDRKRLMNAFGSP